MSITKIPERASEAVGNALAGEGSTRRSFLIRMTVFGSALAVAPIRYLLRPGVAWAANCPQPGGCTSGACTDGYSTFCCTLTGSNNCPSGTHPGGWWYACIGSSYCANNRRYYIDCMGNCPTDCSQCHCANGSCGNRRVCCNNGYTQCGGSSTARLRCRIVRCVNPCTIWSSCSCSGGTDQRTCTQGATCVSHPSSCPSSC
jgi:hypothetical protein